MVADDEVSTARSYVGYGLQPATAAGMVVIDIPPHPERLLVTGPGRGRNANRRTLANGVRYFWSGRRATDSRGVGTSSSSVERSQTTPAEPPSVVCVHPDDNRCDLITLAVSRRRYWRERRYSPLRCAVFRAEHSTCRRHHASARIVRAARHRGRFTRCIVKAANYRLQRRC